MRFTLNPLRWIDALTRPKGGYSRFWLWRTRLINRFRTKYFGYDPFRNE